MVDDHDLDDEGGGVTAQHKRPEPLLSRAKVTAAIAGLASLLVTLGIIPAALGDAITHTAEAVMSGLGLVAATLPVLLHAWQARREVTPTADPRNDAGERLAPVGSAPLVLDAANVLAEMEAIRPAD